MIVVSDTSPIINLAVIGHIQLLQKLFQKILIPQSVYREVAIVGSGLPGSKEVDTLSWIECVEVNNWPLVKMLRKELDEGEAEAITLAVDNNADFVLLDERIGREVASRLGIQFVGVLGIIIHAKQNGHLDKVKPLIDELIIKAGFWISPSLYNYVLIKAGEEDSMNKN